MGAIMSTAVFNTSWLVKVMAKTEKSAVVLATHTFPSRGTAARSLRNYGQAYIERDQERSEYRVFPVRGEKK